MNRRDLVRMGGALGGIALASAADRGAQAGEPGAREEPAPPAGNATARGRVVLSGEGGAAPYFALSEMPEGVERFGIDPRRAESLGRLVLTAAEKGWEVHATYIGNPNGGGQVFDVCVKDFGGR
jgi:hypothetical protein